MKIVQREREKNPCRRLCSRFRRGSRFFLLLTCWLGIVCQSVRATDTNAVLNGWLAAQTNLQTWTAELVQTRTFTTLTHPLVATGRVWFAQPNRFRWELGQPPQTIALRQSHELFVIYPRLKRAERYPINGETTSEWRGVLSLLDAGFPRSRAEVDSQFRIVSISPTNSSWQLKLEPKNSLARRMIKEILVGLATNNFSLASTELVFADGSRMRNDFFNTVLNPEFDATIFDWQPPPDFKVTEPLAR